MAQTQDLENIKKGVEYWNNWRKIHKDIIPDLRGADFTNLDLSGINLKRAKLKEAKFNGATMIEAKLDNAYLRNAEFCGADLTRAEFAGANLRYAIMKNCNLTNAYMRRADLSYVDLSKGNLTETVLEYARFVDTNFSEATLKDCLIYGASVWNLTGKPKEQIGLVITPEIVNRQIAKKPPEISQMRTKPKITVDDLEVAQFIYLILNHSMLRNAITAVTRKGVLLLGRFDDGGIDVLREIAAKLREHGYLPIIFDFDKPEMHDYIETVELLVKLSRFVIADLSGPSVPMELQATVPNTRIPFAPIIEKGRKIPPLLMDFRKYDWWLTPTFVFTDTKHLISGLKTEVIDLAEKKHEELRQNL